MDIIICGAGKVGLAIAKQLLLDPENNITFIDYDENRLNDAKNLDVRTVLGYSSSPEILNLAGAMYTEMIICVTLSDEINMLTAHIAGTIFNIKIKIARIRNSIYLTNKWASHIYGNDAIGIDYIISPEFEVAKHVLSMVKNIGLKDNISFYRQRYSLISIITDNFLQGKTIGFIKNKILTLDISDFSIVFVKRIDDLHFNPNENFTFTDTDEIYIMCHTNDAEEIVSSLKDGTRLCKKILICGGGEIGFSIAKLMQNENFSIKLLEKDKERCDFLAEKLSSVTIINGDMRNIDAIKEAGDIDAMINVSQKDEVNLFTTLLGRTLNIKECFTLIDEYNYQKVFYDINLKNIINTRDITISKILTCIGSKNFTLQETICNGFYNICEFVVKKNAEIIGMEYSKFDGMKMRILAIIRDDALQINGNWTDERFLEGDVAIVIIPYHNTNKLQGYL